MEHVAYIWRRYEHDKKWKRKSKKYLYYTFMVAQDHLQFHISIGTYNTVYLEYNFGSGNQSVIPQKEEPEEEGEDEDEDEDDEDEEGEEEQAPFLSIQEFGPFCVDEEDELDTFLHIMLSFIIWQFENTKAKATIQEALSC
ncbi:hypothetical protein EMCG_04461 [[Emmonsia] crescens]|uniref:Uncharacterized protein n=1 Tax=[Emmonsia] crescens TaxID=73230 RepID=A0A0G2HT26_9EURO|nr:hypothetical protein EMCG_04461 [Emmonsia crescens UAMH 3008]